MIIFFPSGVLKQDKKAHYFYVVRRWRKQIPLSPAGNRTPVSRVTGGDTHHYTTEELVSKEEIL